LDEMRKHKDESFLHFMQSRGATNPVMLDVMQSAVYMAAGVPINEASAYEALRTLRDTDKETTRLASLRKLLLGSEEYDEGVAVGGMEGLVQRVAETINGDYVLNAPVKRIVENEGRVSSVTVLDTELPHSKVVSNIPLSAMPSIVDSQQDQVVQFFEKWSHMKPTRGITLWLGLDKVVIGDLKSRVIVYPGPNRWVVSLSSFDPSCAPEGKELVAIAMMFIEGKTVDEQVQMMKGNGLTELYPDILNHIEMEHVQVSYATRAALIPGQTALDRPGPRTPVKGLYIVGTDTAGEGVGLQQAANSADGVIAAINADARF